MGKNTVRTLVAAVMIGFMTLAQISVFAASSEEIRNEIDLLEQDKLALQKEIEALESRLDENAAELDEIVLQKRVLDKQIFLLQKNVDAVNRQIAVQSLLIADTQDQLEIQQAHLSDLRQKNKERIRAMEEAGPVSYWVILFESRSFTDFLDRVEMIRQINASDRRRLQEIRDSADAVVAIQEQLKTEKAALEVSKQELLTSQINLGDKSEESQFLIQELLSKGEDYEKLLEQSERMQEELMHQIAQKEDDFDKAAYEEWLATQKQDGVQVQPDATSWLTPVPSYTLTSPFGLRLHPILGIYRMHNGVDMACPAGTPIYASRGGQVTIATESDSAGFYVQINHGDGYRSVYMHMTHYIVSAGEYVTAGQIIGYVGNTGLSKGNHLHFGISYNGEYVNPMEYLQ